MMYLLANNVFYLYLVYVFMNRKCLFVEVFPFFFFWSGASRK